MIDTDLENVIKKDWSIFLPTIIFLYLLAKVLLHKIVSI